MTQKYILALDQYTTSTRAILFDKKGDIFHSTQQEFPQSGWGEHNQEQILGSNLSCIASVLSEKHVHADQILGISITNQRETTIV